MMIRHLMGVVVCIFIATASYAQVCDGPLTVSIDGSTSGDALSVTCAGTDPECNTANLTGLHSGTVVPTVTGGTAPFTYSWTQDGTDMGLANTTDQLQNLGEGIYAVTVTDDQMCTAECSVELFEPDPILFTLNPDDPDCFADNTTAPDGGITITGISGGTGAYGFSWTGPGGFVASTQDIANLGGGEYCVTVSDANGCEESDCITLDEPEPMTLALTPEDPDCHANNSPLGVNGTIDLEITNGAAPFTIDWSGTGAVDGVEDQTGLDGGSYSVLVTDDNGCTAMASVDLTGAPELAIDATPVDPDCNAADSGGLGNGTITINSVANSTGTLTYNWTGTNASNASGANQTGLVDGPYAVTITDANGCEISDNWTLEQPDPMEITATGTDPNCHEDSLPGAATEQDGSVMVSVVNGNPPYSYDWSGPGITAGSETGTSISTGLGGGTYTVVVTDDTGCVQSGEVTLGEPDPILFTLNPDNPDCFADNTDDPDGGITITGITGGTGAYGFSWTGPDGFVASTQDISMLGGGEYCVTVSDANGCEESDCITLDEPLEMTVALTPDHPDCNAANTTQVNGTITPAITNGSPPYTYDWDGPPVYVTGQDDADMITNAGDGTYTVTVTDDSGCTAVATIDLDEPPVIVVLGSVTDLSCNPSNFPAGDQNPDGEIALVVSGGTITVSGVYTFNWSGPGIDGTNQTLQDQVNLPAGAYSVTVTDDFNCEQVANFDVDEPTEILVTSEFDDLACNADNASGDGAIRILTVTGGVGNSNSDYTYDWEGPGGFTSTSEDLTNLAEGTYTVTITDQTGCENIETFTLGQPDAVECSLANTTPILCYGEDGVITVTATGGTGTYEYSIDGGATWQPSPTFTVNLGTALSQTFTITTRDIPNLCENTCEITVEQPEDFTAGTCVVNMDECQLDEGEIQVCAYGGVAPYTISWSSASGGTLNEGPGDQTLANDGDCFTYTGAQGGETYVFVITDDNGCILGN